MSSIEKLKKYQQQGFLFHGSPKGGLEKIVPKKASDAKKKSGFNVDKAVFAAAYPEPAVVFACLSFRKIPKKLREGGWGIGKTEDNSQIIAKIPEKWKKFLAESRGYVYVLPERNCTEESRTSWQVKFKEPVKPIDCVEVSFVDFEKLGGLVRWVD